jgi:hypothetical protein
MIKRCKTDPIAVKTLFLADKKIEASRSLVSGTTDVDEEVIVFLIICTGILGWDRN